jgi:hypothetical protein
MISAYIAFFGTWYYALAFTAWALGGAIHYGINYEKVHCQPQKIVYAIICGPIIWTIRTFGFCIDLCDVVFAGFKKWLFASEKPKTTE